MRCCHLIVLCHNPSRFYSWTYLLTSIFTVVISVIHSTSLIHWPSLSKCVLSNTFQGLLQCLYLIIHYFCLGVIHSTVKKISQVHFGGDGGISILNYYIHPCSVNVLGCMSYINSFIDLTPGLHMGESVKCRNDTAMYCVCCVLILQRIVPPRHQYSSHVL